MVVRAGARLAPRPFGPKVASLASPPALGSFAWVASAVVVCLASSCPLAAGGRWASLHLTSPRPSGAASRSRSPLLAFRCGRVSACANGRLRPYIAADICHTPTATNKRPRGEAKRNDPAKRGRFFPEGRPAGPPRRGARQAHIPSPRQVPRQLPRQVPRQADPTPVTYASAILVASPSVWYPNHNSPDTHPRYDPLAPPHRVT